MKRGDVFYLKADDAWGREISVGRPMLILSSDGEISRAPVVIVASLTTTPREYVPSAVRVESTSRESWVLCNQLRSVDKERLVDYMCTLSSEEMEKVEEALTQTLGLPKTTAEVDELGTMVELEMYKRLYEKALTDLVEVRHQFNLLKLAATSNYGVPKKEEPRLEVDTVALKTRMMGGELVDPVDREEEIPRELRSVYSCNDDNDRGLTPEEIDEYLLAAGLPATSHLPQNGGVLGKAKVRPGAKPVNVNTATRKDFLELGMGEGVSGNIIRFRNKYGKFSDFGELLQVPGVGKGVFTVFAPMWRL